MSHERKFLSAEQTAIVTELVEAHGLDPEQISFEGMQNNPILNFEALSALSVKLTDIQNLDTFITERTDTFVKARCLVELPDGRTRKIEESAYIGEPLGGTTGTIDSLRLAEQVAQSRAARRGIRSVGINLYKAHKEFLKNGNLAAGHTNHDPRVSLYAEIHKNAEKLGLIVGKDRAVYELFLAEWYDGRTSAKELTEFELNRFNIQLRSLVRAQQAAFAANKIAA